MFKNYIIKKRTSLKFVISKKVYFICFSIILFFIFLFTNNYVQAGLFDSTPEIVNTLNSAFQKIQEWLLKLATPAAAVAVGVGVFMQKFSFGDEERIRTAKKVIKSTLFCYGFILVLNLILSAIKTLLT